MPPRPPLRLVRGGSPPAPPPQATTLASPSGERRTALELTALGTGLVLTAVLMARLPPWSQALGTFQSLYGVAFVFYALALPRALRAGGVRHGALLALAVAAAARLALLPVTPSLSDDVYRYLWEGRVAAHGHDPWHASPADPALAPLRDERIHARVNHPELAAIYPPLAIAGFALVAALSPTVAAMKAWVILHDLVLVALLVAWGGRAGAPTGPRRGGAPAGPLAAIAYAWNPLVLVEGAGSGHNDPTAIVWLVAALMLAERRPVASALALTAGTLVKLVPLVALPFLLRIWPVRARVVALALLVPSVGAYALAARGPASGLAAYAGLWANNELAFLLLAAIARDAFAARVLAGALLAALAAWLVARMRHTAGEAGRATRTVLRAGFLLSPVAHPWYLMWVLALEPLRPSAPWLLLSLTAILSYGVFAPPLEGGAFHLPLAWRWIEYGAPLALAVALAVRRARSPAPA